MNSLGVTLFWCVLQVTVLALVGAVATLLVRRISVSAAALVAATTLIWVAALTFWAFAPGPRWTLVRFGGESPSDAAATDNIVGPTNSAVESRSPAEPMGAASGTRSLPAGLSSLDLFWQTFQRVARDESQAPPRTFWSAAVGVFLILSLLGGLRIAVAFCALARLRKRSVPIRDPGLHRLVRELSAALGGMPAVVELRESSEFSSAATLGWRRPLILLPLEWRDWSDDSLRAVLAHELAHIARRDYLVWLLAQVGVALHAYHPLIWWLAGRLREEQECAADAAACRLSGGPKRYLSVLATLALAEDDRRLAWATHPFLPSRQTFLRRLNMLRQWKSVPGPLPRGARWITVAVLTSLAVLASGLRGPQTTGPGTALAVTTAGQASGGQPPLDSDGGIIGQAVQHAVRFVPRDPVFVISIRVDHVLADPRLKDIQKALLEEPEEMAKMLGVNLDEIEQVQVVLLGQGDDRRTPGAPCVIMHTRRPVDEKAVIEMLAPGGESEIYATYTIHHGLRTRYCAIPSPRTILISDDATVMRRCLVAGENAARTAGWYPAFQQAENGEFVVLFNPPLIRAVLDADLSHAPPQASALAGLLAPLWRNTQTVTGRLSLSDAGVNLQVIADCGNVNDAKRVEETSQAAMVFAKNGLAQGRAVAAQAPGDAGPLLLRAIDIAETILDRRELTRSENSVTITSNIDSATTTELIKITVPSIISARQSASRMVAQNNLKQIALAMHNYYDTYGHFPPSVVMGPDGKTPHSWRVAILPYLEQAPLHNQYRFDEPWDSPANLRILERMPDVYRSTNAARDTNASSYFGLVGKGTAFGDPKGRKFQNIIDGTSNTILVVEAKRDIPWTKPEDIAYDPAAKVPDLGGCFPGLLMLALCDGSVHQIPADIDDKLLRTLIEGDDGNVVDWDRIRKD